MTLFAILLTYMNGFILLTFVSGGKIGKGGLSRRIRTQIAGFKKQGIAAVGKIRKLIGPGTNARKKILNWEKNTASILILTKGIKSCFQSRLLY